MLARVELNPDQPQAAPPPPPVMHELHPEPSLALAGAEPAYELADGGGATLTAVRSEAVDPNNPATWANSPRNAPCPCGSGKKFKHCHGKLA